MKLKTYSERKMMRKSQMIKESGDYVSAIKSLVDDFEDVKKTIKNSTVTAFEVWLELGVKSGAIKEKDAKKLMNQMVPESKTEVSEKEKLNDMVLKLKSLDATEVSGIYEKVFGKAKNVGMKGFSNDLIQLGAAIAKDKTILDSLISEHPSLGEPVVKRDQWNTPVGEAKVSDFAFFDVMFALSHAAKNGMIEADEKTIDKVISAIPGNRIKVDALKKILADHGFGEKADELIAFTEKLVNGASAADATNEGLEDGEMDVKQLAKSYGVKLLPADIEELGETTSREKFKEYFNIPDDADENPNYRRDESMLEESVSADQAFKNCAVDHFDKVKGEDEDGNEDYWENLIQSIEQAADRAEVESIIREVEPDTADEIISKIETDAEPLINEANDTKTEVKPTHICIVDLKDGVDATPLIPEGAKVHISDDLVVEDIESGFTCDIDEQELEINFEPIDITNEAEDDEASKSDGGGEPSEEAVAALEDEIEQALKAVINDLPKELKTIADGGELELASNFDKEASKELNEAVGALIAGGALALPAITQILGKTVKWAGAKLGSEDVQSWGKAIEHVGHELHHKYEKLIDKILSPLTKHMDPEKRVIANKLVFYSLVAVLGGAGIAGAVKAAGAGHAGLAAVESGLSSVKVSELVAAAKEVIPRVLGNLMKAA